MRCSTLHLKPGRLTLAPFHQNVDLVAFAAVDSAGQVGDRRFNHVDDLGMVLELALYVRPG